MCLLAYCSLKVTLLMESMHIFVTMPCLMSGVLSVNLTTVDIQEMYLQASSQNGSLSFLSTNNCTLFFFFFLKSSTSDLIKLLSKQMVLMWQILNGTLTEQIGQKKLANCKEQNIGAEGSQTP